MISPSKFRIKPGGQPFSKSDFDECPAWSEYYDFEELNTISSWGVDANAAAKILFRDSGGSHPHYTILDLERLPHENMRIFLKADVFHPTGQQISGYVMNANAFVIGLFLEAKEFSFSRHSDLLGVVLPEKKEVEALWGVSELFPLTYKTKFLDPKGKLIAGEFTISN